ncbi:hypothetical protein DEU56DRAFT_775929 [Suillus clintonianus]|uniref:uncharacterized protein n=1 Tax=Suillus clintonianus TaxID=1904413 RepID=UPI001B866901|nr:uncharacterized protein DEU56DRAFT_775929 [Suillus clintonianus]KAG2152764.1 hypothetical protein DEU56DRAFT_775929 [Suillus clintonianus]
MMLTSHFTILALLTFLTGANAGCAACADTLEVDGVAVYTLVNSTIEYKDGYTLCTYENILGLEVTCEYSDRGAYVDGDDLCPRGSKSDTIGC